MNKNQIMGLAVICMGQLWAAAGDGILAGSVSTTSSYAALITPEGQLVPLDLGTTPQLQLYVAAINQNGVGLLGGQQQTNSDYVAVVHADGSVTLVSGLPVATNDMISSVAINNSGVGLVGSAGGGSTSGTSYVALIENGSAVAVTGDVVPNTANSLYVAINSASTGLIGGTLGATTPYLYAGTIQNGVLTNFSSLSSIEGQIQSVAINDQGLGLLGGFLLPSGAPYVATVLGTTVSSVTLPFSAGAIYAVAINANGVGLIGGESIASSFQAYAALIKDGVVQALTGDALPTNNYSINYVAINSYNNGILGGANTATNAPYVALVKNGVVQTVSIPTAAGVESVSISDADVSLVFCGNYAALIAPNGGLTSLAVPSTLSAYSQGYGMYSIAAVAPYVASAVPQSVGPYMGAINAQLNASFALTSHTASKRRVWHAIQRSDEMAFMADADDVVWGLQKNVHAAAPEQQPKYSLWAAPFGAYIHQSNHGEIPKIDNDIGGALAGFDCRGENFLMGGGLGYAYNYMHYGASIGHGHAQEEMAYLYGVYQKGRWWFDCALWGGVYQAYNERHSVGGLATSKASLHGWLLDPHIEAAYAYIWQNRPWFSLEPFVMFDWINNWQGHFTEHGVSGFNVVMHSQYNSLLRSEAGLRFYEQLHYGWGEVVLEQKASYANQAPFHFNRKNVAFVSAVSTFPVAIGSSKTENLLGIELRSAFLPNGHKLPYAIFDFQGQFGSSYQSYFGSIELGRDF